MLKNVILFFASLFLTLNVLAQETTQRKLRLTDNVTEVLTVLKNDKNIRQGLYQALYKRKTPVATGMFENDKKAGVWRFFDPKGQVMQVYNYTSQTLNFEAKEDTSSNLRYFVDKLLDSGSVVTKPIKIGGRYFGYIPYLQLFKLPKDLSDINRGLFSAIVELLVSPGGRLADYKVHINGATYAGVFERVINMNTHLPNPDDMVFTPATLNSEPISCRIMIKAYITDDGHLDFDY